MKNHIFLFIILFAFSFNAVAQVNDELNEFYDINNFQNLITKQNNTNYNDIKGSPYLTEKFINSLVYFNEDSVLKIELRYNMYDNSMEYKENNIVYSISNPQVIEKIEMDKWVFVFYYNPYNQKYNSFYELLVSGKSRLLVKKNISFKKAEPPKAIIESEPAKFVKRKDTYFVINGASSPILVKSKSLLAEIFFDKKEEIKRFLKKEKISYKKRNDLIRLVEYYNDL